MKKTVIRVLAVLFSFVVVCLASFGMYLRNYHAGDVDAVNTIHSPSKGVSAIVTDEIITFVPEENIRAGIVFYPGMKIRGEAYAVLADALAEEGYLCVLVNMPLNMSVLNPDAALSVMEAWPEIEEWFIGGHSLGGQVAQKCVLNHPGVFKGLITVARQIDYDFSDNDIPVLGIYGSNDKICTLANIASGASRANPDHYTEVIIEGGCHGYFGNYGYQRWDGDPTISREEQMEATIHAMLEYMGKN